MCACLPATKQGIPPLRVTDPARWADAASAALAGADWGGRWSRAIRRGCGNAL